MQSKIINIVNDQGDVIERLCLPAAYVERIEALAEGQGVGFDDKLLELLTEGLRRMAAWEAWQGAGGKQP